MHPLMNMGAYGAYRVVRTSRKQCGRKRSTERWMRQAIELESIVAKRGDMITVVRVLLPTYIVLRSHSKHNGTAAANPAYSWFTGRARYRFQKHSAVTVEKPRIQCYVRAEPYLPRSDHELSLSRQCGSFHGALGFLNLEYLRRRELLGPRPLSGARNHTINGSRHPL